jgi:hypothetical protein
LFKAQKIWDFGNFVSSTFCREMGLQSFFLVQALNNVCCREMGLQSFFLVQALNNVCQRGWSSLFLLAKLKIKASFKNELILEVFNRQK